MQIKDIHDLFEKFDNSSLTELRLHMDSFKLLMKKGGKYEGSHSEIHQSLTAGTAPAPNVPEAKGAQNKAAEDTEYVTAPIVGTFYRASTPDSPPFVEPGTKVKAGETICIIEAMKVMNELEADFNLEVVSVLVENAVMVEHGTPLFEVKRI